MNAVKMVAIILIMSGALMLLYGGFKYTRESHKVELGTLELSLSKKKTVNIPVWAGVAAIVFGSVLLAVPLNRKNN